MAQPGDVVITTRELYDEMRAVHDEVKSIGEKVADIADHEARIRSLERKVWVALGGGSVLGGLAGTLATVLLGGA
ncbi:hypothetical protein ACFORH_42945 [Amycolatopsis roodepoortensis]|uniref:Hemolysin XhlA n=1 Tax=Amycolatopsis roodepoortensis TaxID=700274 RepID=A0ABR9L3F4_9PSEU|nr:MULTISPECIES: hypothetical protein [Amycolatopsis]MBE1575070.1 hypothetical protein [Amycolatopsis roodepoortensis]GHG97539.1 hypothetical protein GCM10017788_77120 [Amycolatopsis acidiphila]